MTPIDRRHFLQHGGLGSFAALGLSSSAGADEPGPAPPAPPQFGVSVLGFGADPGGTRDSTAAFQKAVDEAAGGCLLVPRGRYRLRRQVTITRSGLSIVGESCRGERLLGSVLFKDDGFAGDALLKASGSDGNLSGLSISGIAVDGRGQPGSGLSFEKVGNAVLSSVVSQNNPDWGIALDGVFFGSLHQVAAMRNGTFSDGAARGGGLLLSGNSRECADCRLFDSYFNKNRGAQLLLTGTGGKSRVVGFTVYGCQFELPEHEDERVPVVAIEACDRSTFFGCNFVQPVGMSAPCLGLGGKGSELNDVSFVSCYFQYNGSRAALQACRGTRSVSFVDYRSRGKGELFDFSEDLDKGSIYFSRPIDLARGKGRAAIAFPLMGGG